MCVCVCAHATSSEDVGFHNVMAHVLHVLWTKARTNNDLHHPRYVCVCQHKVQSEIVITTQIMRTIITIFTENYRVVDKD